MDLKTLATTFMIVLLAELGDKTQLATIFLAAEHQSKISVFFGAAGALAVTSFIAVVLGYGFSHIIPQNYIRIGAGAFFIIFGIIMLIYR
ncbi:MAG: TMEM165/GDT1 family protein [Deltaproteobacteria bacterium]|nr:TMEM165/GDT1 family protein [Deltaproteobacteria bacterium]